LLLMQMLSCGGGGNAHELAVRLEREFTAEVPPGSAKEQVTAFLIRRHIEYHEEKSLRLITASVRDVEKNVLTTFGVFMKFQFDAADRLVSYEIKALGTGP
jgi:hypothetical protein